MWRCDTIFGVARTCTRRHYCDRSINTVRLYSQGILKICSFTDQGKLIEYDACTFVITISTLTPLFSIILGSWLLDSFSMASTTRCLQTLHSRPIQYNGRSSKTPLKPRYQLRHASVRRRTASELQKDVQSAPRPPQQEPSKIFAPKTRIAVGIVFVGALIYSMVTSHLVIFVLLP